MNNGAQQSSANIYHPTCSKNVNPFGLITTQRRIKINSFLCKSLHKSCSENFEHCVHGLYLGYEVKGVD